MYGSQQDSGPSLHKESISMVSSTAVVGCATLPRRTGAAQTRPIQCTAVVMIKPGPDRHSYAPSKFVPQSLQQKPVQQYSGFKRWRLVYVPCSTHAFAVGSTSSVRGLAPSHSMVSPFLNSSTYTCCSSGTFYLLATFTVGLQTNTLPPCRCARTASLPLSTPPLTAVKVHPWFSHDYCTLRAAPHRNSTSAQRNSGSPNPENLS